MRVLIRCDASLQIGTGHIYRCLALAEQLRDGGHTVDFACAPLEGNLISLISELRFNVVYCNQIHGIPDFASNLIKYDYTIIDHYGIDAATEIAFRQFTKKIISIDDWGSRKHCVDLIIDPSQSGSSTLRQLANIGTPFFHGLEWPMLRKEFREIRSRVRPKNYIEKVLLFFGGTDPAGLVLPFIHEVVARRDVYPEIEFNFLVSKFHPLQEKFEKIVPPRGVNIIFSPNSVAELMLDCDFYIGSAGSVTWERMCLGLSGIVLSVADNQEDLAATLSRSGYHLYIGKATNVSIFEALHILKHYIDNPSGLAGISERCFNSVDGKGVERIVALMESSF